MSRGLVIVGVAFVLAVATLACSDAADQQAASACVEQATRIDARPTADGGLEREHVIPLIQHCSWVHERCDREALTKVEPSIHYEPRRLIEACQAPSCPIGPAGSPACIEHWHEQLDLERSIDELDHAVRAFHRAAIDDQLARTRVKLGDHERDLIARAWARWWRSTILARKITVSPPSSP